MIKLQHFEFDEDSLEMNLNLLKHQKRIGEFEEALKLIDFIEFEFEKPLHLKYPLKITLNKEKAIINRKLGNKYEGLICDLFCEIHQMYNFTKPHFDNVLNEYFFTEAFYSKYDEITKSYLIKFIDWYKPISKKIIKEIISIKNEINEDYLNYTYHDLLDLELYVYSKNTKFVSLINEIDLKTKELNHILINI